MTPIVILPHLLRAQSLKKKHFQVSFRLFQDLLNYLGKNKNYVCS